MNLRKEDSEEEPNDTDSDDGAVEEEEDEENEEEEIDQESKGKSKVDVVYTVIQILIWDRNQIEKIKHQKRRRWKGRYLSEMYQF